MVSGVAGIASGIIDYGFGKLIGLSGFEKMIGKRKTKKGVTLYKKFGVWGIAVSAVTSLPYSVICWMAGVLRMNYWKFLIAVSLTRVPCHILVAIYFSRLVND